jgi:hypothetical protein
MRAHWERFGALPAIAIVAGLYAVAYGGSLAFGGATDDAIALTAFGVLVLYCLARGGWDVFWIAVSPGGFASLLHDLFDLPRTPIALGLLPLALFAAWVEDHPDDDAAGEEDAPPPPAARAASQS